MSASAQSMSLPEIRTAYRALQLDTAERELRSIIAAPAGRSVSDLTESHLLLGIITHTRNRADEARAQFTAALQLDPTARPNPLDTSPKTMAFFDEIQTAFAANQSSREPNGEVTYIRVADVRPAAAMRSMMVPGWGQLHRGDRTKGLIVASAWAVTFGTTAASHIVRRDAKRDYESEADPDKVEDRYDRFNSWNRRRGIAAIAAGTVWAYAYVDAITTQRGADIRISHNVSLKVGNGGNLASLRVQIP